MKKNIPAVVITVFLEFENAVGFMHIEMKAADVRFRRVFGGSPTVSADTTFYQLFGADKVQIGGEYDIRPRVFWSDDNEAYIAEIKSRPLMLPISISRYGCLKTAIATNP